MKNLILLTLSMFLFLSCKNNEPDISEVFVGTFARQELTNEYLKTIEWKITKQSADRVNIEVKESTDYNKFVTETVVKSYSINAVLISPVNTLRFDNPFKVKSEEFVIEGIATLENQEIKPNLTARGKAGYIEILNQKLKKQ